jgi:transcriptional regulator with XRE-family HTH domain
MGHKRRGQPKHLPAKLLAIRKFRGASQTEMVQLLNFQITSARISEYERGIREPNSVCIAVLRSRRESHG